MTCYNKCNCKFEHLALFKRVTTYVTLAAGNQMRFPAQHQHQWRSILMQWSGMYTVTDNMLTKIRKNIAYTACSPVHSLSYRSTALLTNWSCTCSCPAFPSSAVKIPIGCFQSHMSQACHIWLVSQFRKSHWSAYVHNKSITVPCAAQNVPVHSTWWNEGHFDEAAVIL